MCPVRSAGYPGGLLRRDEAHLLGQEADKRTLILPGPLGPRFAQGIQRSLLISFSLL